MPVSSPFRFRRRHCVGLPNINITNIHQQAPLDIKPPSSRALCPAIPVSLSGIIAGMPAEKNLISVLQLHSSRSRLVPGGKLSELSEPFPTRLMCPPLWGFILYSPGFLPASVELAMQA
uniref:Uncharacterized protein n=1 Tax=Moniliophthora roreri TaxID=221103 RepID=A0A0W0GBA3_MONRR